MRRTIENACVTAWALIFLFGLFYISQSEAFWQSRDSNYNISIGGSPPPAYTGPGDVVSGAVAWWGLRCYNNAYSGNVADIWDSATGNTTETLLTCSSGGTINQTINALSVTCAVACKVKTLYDQSGAGDCSGVCDLVPNVGFGSTRPVFTQNCIGSLPCMTFASASNIFFDSANASAGHATPTSLAAVALANSGRGGNENLVGLNYVVRYPSTASTIQDPFGTTATASDDAFHVVIYFGNNGATFNIDGSNGSSNSVGGVPAISAAAYNIANSNTGNTLDGKISELGFWPVLFTGTQVTNMCHNMFSYWGTPTSC